MNGPTSPEANKPCARHADVLAVSFCVRCGSGLCPACAFQESGRIFCERCAAFERQKKIGQAFDRLRPAARVAAETAAPLGSHSVRRVYARCLDLAVVAAAGWFCGIGLNILLDAWKPEVEGFPSEFCAFAGISAVSFLYFTGLEGIFGQTLGKRLFGLRVTRADGARYAVWPAMWRWVGFFAAVVWAGFGLGVVVFLDRALEAVGLRANFLLLAVLYVFGALTLLVFGAGLVIAFLGKQKRGFHDLIGDSRVIDVLTPEKQRRTRRD